MSALNAEPDGTTNTGTTIPTGALPQVLPGSLRNLFGWLAAGYASMFIVSLGAGTVLNPLLVEHVVGSAHKVSALGVVSGVSAVFAALANLVAGAWSDRMGRRNPFILGGGLLAAVSLAFLGGAGSLLLITLLWSVSQFFLGAYQAALTAVVPDRIPKHRLGTASAIVGAGLPFGGLVGVLAAGALSKSLAVGYLVFAVVIALTAVLFARRIKDVPRPRSAPGRPGLRRQAAALASSLRDHDFRWAFTARVLMVLGYFSVFGYQLYILQDHVTMPHGISPTTGVGILTAIGMIATGVAAVLGGLLSDRLGRRRIFMTVAGVVLGLVMILPIVSPTWPVMMVFSLLNGLAFGCFMAVDIAVVITVLPSESDAARDLGVLNVANAGPQIFAPFLAALLIAHLGGYDALFAVAGVFAIAGAAAASRIRKIR
ncbi:MFS transporter [Streptacidiphilus sp. P02-A3a]|uniref:MFS transporter n=1 Tax=Streptacidiphilus sp. P02-A3a TaxID=2704468 RepID=UPI0015FDC580|nr:MFS transporter [Streptacidiphilus sp. P02-A3a]QMU69750.1 MFS transporter [Streptacidiphilus sp. P02-A3a]